MRSSRDRLLAAAVEVFVEQGYEGARVQDIARAAGLTTGAIYANFRGKAELLFEAIGVRADAEMDEMLTEARRRDVRQLLELLERAKRDGSIDAALDTDAFARFCLTLAMGALVMRTLQAPPPDGDAWHQLISRLLDAVSREQK